LTGSKWDVTINKVEGKPSKFGKGGAHICLPREWLKETVVVVTKKDVGGVTAKMTSRDEVDWVERKSR
jgi:hypothetical protein